jgi:hypothetical protein
MHEASEAVAAETIEAIIVEGATTITMDQIVFRAIATTVDIKDIERQNAITSIQTDAHPTGNPKGQTYSLLRETGIIQPIQH